MTPSTYKNKNINPSQFPNEIFEYYSIPAFQNGEKPEFTQGKEIHSNKLLLEADSIVFGKLNPRVEKVWRIGNHSEHRKIGTTEWITVTPNESLNPDFLYFVEWSKFVMPIAKSLVSGSTPSRQRVDPTSFYKLKIPVPPLPEQRKITHVLSTVRKAIEQQDKLIRTTTELKKALMQKLFTEGTRGEPLKETEIGFVPESWGVVRIEKLVTIKGGFAFKSKEKVPYSNTQLIRMGNLYQNSLDLSRSPIFYPDSFKNQYSDFVLKEGDLIMSLTGTMGKEDYGFTVKLPKTNKILLLNQRVAKFVVKTDDIIKDYLKYYLLSRIFLDKLYKTAKGTKQANLSSNEIKKLDVLVPNKVEQELIVRQLSILVTKIEFHQTKKQTLTDLFKTLLHELMTGQRRVHELEFEKMEDF